MTSIENAIETVEHQIEIPSELPTDNPVLRLVFYMVRRGLVPCTDTSSKCPFDLSGQFELILISVMLV